MKNKIIIVLSLLFVLACIFLYLSNEQTKKHKAEADRQSHNVEVLNSDLKHYKTRSGEDAARIEALTYTVDEFKRNEPRLKQTIADLELKLKNVNSVAEIRTSTGVQIKTVIQYVDSSKCFFYEDKFNTVSGCFDKDSVEMSVETRDSLSVVVSGVPKHKFLWWSWGVKAVELDVKAQNPGTKFTYLKYIELK